MINSFTQVGLEDPFPNDDEYIEGSLDDVDPEVYRVPTKPEDTVYGESRFIEGFGPYCLYIPRKEIMLKLMRACVNCKEPSDLWFNQEIKREAEEIDFE